MLLRDWRQHGVVALLGFEGLNITEGREEASVPETVHPFELGMFNRFKGSPRSPPLDDLSLVKAVDLLAQCVVVAFTNAADRCLNPGDLIPENWIVLS